MTNLRVVVAAAVNCFVCLAALGQTVKPEHSAILGGPLIEFTPANAVTIYEQKSFSGRSQALTAGDHRLTDWKPASIRVPAGSVAYLYQSVDSGGGYGISVDLMEDHSDLAEFGLQGHVSLITIFPSTRDNFFWARGSVVNGEFVAGHWERSRAGGNPVNTIAVASPPLPSRAPPPVTSIQQQGTTWTITTLGPQSTSDASMWNRADKTMGVIGSDFRGPQEIGSAKFQRASNNILIPDWIEFWFPNKQANDHRSMVYFKRTLTGVITDKITKNWSGKVPDFGGGLRTISGTYELSDVPHVANISGTYPDYDLNIDIAPFVDYMYLINDSHKPERSLEVKMKDLVDSDHDPCTDPFIKVEAEVDAGIAAKRSIAASLQQRIGKQVAVYGPWIYDIGHCDHPEIHPAEEIWWMDYAPNNVNVYHLNVFADSSKRFWWRSQMDDGTKLHPWGAPPIIGLFAITFEASFDPIRAGADGGKRFEVENVDHWNVATIPGGNKVYDLVYQGKTLVSFIPHNDAFKVSYENVGLKPGSNNIVRGFLVIETTVGTVTQIATKVTLNIGGQQVSVNVPQGADPDKIDERFEPAVFKKEAGHYVFTVKRTDIGGSVTALE
jgi:hypothetical protein